MDDFFLEGSEEAFAPGIVTRFSSPGKALKKSVLA